MEKGVVIKVKLLPRSSRNHIVGIEEDRYRIKVTAPPVDGKANAALIKLLSKKLEIPGRDIEILSGHTSRLKTLRIKGLPLGPITAKLLQSH